MGELSLVTHRLSTKMGNGHRVGLYTRNCFTTDVKIMNFSTYPRIKFSKKVNRTYPVETLEVFFFPKLDLYVDLPPLPFFLGKNVYNESTGPFKSMK